MSVSPNGPRRGRLLRTRVHHHVLLAVDRIRDGAVDDHAADHGFLQDFSAIGVEREQTLARPTVFGQRFA